MEKNELGYNDNNRNNDTNNYNKNSQQLKWQE